MNRKTGKKLSAAQIKHKKNRLLAAGRIVKMRAARPRAAPARKVKERGRQPAQPMAAARASVTSAKMCRKAACSRDQQQKKTEKEKAKDTKKRASEKDGYKTVKKTRRNMA